MKTLKKLAVCVLAMWQVISCSTEKNTSNNSLKYQPPIAEATAFERATEIVSKMSLDEKLSLIRGYKGFFIKGFEKYGMPDIYLSDASQGVHIRKNFKKADLVEYALPKSVAFPNTLCLAATWNPDLAHKYANSIGEECKAAGIGVLLGPGMNIYRNAQNGRNFEYMGEDPYLAARMVEKYVVGVQNNGVVATLKHFVANNTDYRRRASNSVVSERALHEIYLPAFKAGVDAGAMAVMTAYNQVNGEWAGQSDFVINSLLREQLGFKHLVMTDWWSVNDCKALVKSGQDLEMPGGESMDSLAIYIDRGEVEIEDINRMCTSIIKTVVMMGFLDNPIKDTTYLQNFEAHEKVALNTAREGIVLLRNNDNLLPIDPTLNKKILLTGLYVEENIYGGGSGEVAGYNHVTILDALSKTHSNLSYKVQASDADMQEADIIIVSVATFDYEGCDRHFGLSPEQEALVQRASTLNKNTLVIANTGSAIRMADWNMVKAIIYNWYPGQAGNKALAEIISGKLNPGGKLPMTIEKEFKDSPAYGYVPEGTRFLCDEEGFLDIHSKVKRWSYDVNIQQAPEYLYDVEYKEGVLVGYRWYEAKGIEPLFPFGYGLSYTTFEISDLSVSADKIAVGEELTINCTVKNTGEKFGTTVVQVYVGEENPVVIRPMKELKAFKKIELEAGESQNVELVLNKQSFSYWSEKEKDWAVNSGAYKVLLGQSSADIEQTALIKIE